MSKEKEKKEIISEDQYITKPDDKIVAKNEDTKEEVKKSTNNKCLFKCENEINAYDYKKMAKYFPKGMYWVFVIRSFFLNIVLTSLISLIYKNSITSLIFFIVFQVYFLIYYKVRLEPVSEKIFNDRLKRGEIDTHFETEFYEDYFIRKGEKITFKIDYSDISRCVENDTHFYLEYPQRNTIMIIRKNNCDLELINFIRKKFKDLENHLGDASSYKGTKKANNSKLINALMIILFIATLFCIWGAVWSVSLMHKINPQYGISYMKNTWVVLCWLPIPIASIVLGYIFNNKGFKCTKNIVAGFFISFLLLVSGLSSFSPIYSEDYNEVNDYDDYNKINDYREYIDADIPSNGKLEIQNYETYFDDDKTEYTIIDVYYDIEVVSKLVSSIENSDNWVLSTERKSELKMLLPSQFKSKDNVYFSVYNKTTNEYNTIPSESGEYEIYAMSYDELTKVLSIHKYKFRFNK